MRLTEHFTLEELTASETAARRGIDNTPPRELLPNLLSLARHLERVRAVLLKPIHINSGYRCLAVNEAVGSKPTSAHVQGLAADIICPAFGTALDICKAIAALDDLPFDQCIYEFGAWCHVGFAEDGKAARRQLLTIDKDGARVGF